MSKTKGEGRSAGEKGGRLITTLDDRRKKREAEEAEWAARSGPVETRRIHIGLPDGRCVHCGTKITNATRGRTCGT